MPGEDFWRRPGPTQGCRAIEEEEEETVMPVVGPFCVEVGWNTLDGLSLCPTPVVILPSDKPSSKSTVIRSRCDGLIRVPSTLLGNLWAINSRYSQPTLLKKKP
ncbi:hypothetical protein TNCV_3010031 [Trichonephila clavipes]|nr:hypothetical protein TNCV_3010031 [Trichonephila clavipes]